MTRRRVLLLGLVAVAAALAFAAQVVWPRQSAINPENAARIKPGMTLAEAEAVLGGPARDETGGNAKTYYSPIGLVLESECREWISWNGTVLIVFTEDARVRLAVAGRPLPRNESFLEMVRRRLALSPTGASYSSPSP